MQRAHATAFWSLIDSAGLAALDRGPRSGVRELAALNRALDACFAGERLPPARLDALRALTLLWHDQLDAAHELVQAHEGDADADYVHALLHRREGDYANAKYWFGQVGDHAVYAVIATAALVSGQQALLRGGQWSPSAGVDAVARAGADGTAAEALKALQGAEFRALAAHLLER